ncbi:HNH endonuclease signature motif containing protein [Microbacterium sp. C7(2022)]|uniref:HNH endonuclease signature motif containing protein n=1 Tax=Microbacterium sp. C7(2022) TaxID=2992759 RepID=UPI00237BD170|nr:HNH endonuclease signature motif containing protein [Microbacterium sp. C7(2022)]MDE0546511.1 HNH endonuclease [Microbacterium sp. C7(2022)]
MIDDEQARADAQRTAAFVGELERIASAEAELQAQKARVLADAYALTEAQKARVASNASRERDMPLRSMAAELAAPMRMNDRTMQTHLYDAHRLVSEYSSTFLSLQEGRINRGHVAVILEAGRDLEDDEASRAAFEQAVLPFAEESTPARTRAYAKQVAELHNPRTLQERHDIALTTRRAWASDLGDGMAFLGIIGPAAEIFGAHDRLTKAGKAIKDADRAARVAAAEVESAGGHVRPGAGAGAGAETAFDERTLDQIRADVALDMLLTGAPAIDPTGDLTPGGLGAIRAHVQITVPVTTLTGTTTHGALLDGQYPIDPETARRLAGAATGWDRVMTHPITGVVLAVDRYTPSAEQKRFLQARDVHCRFPGCRRPARQCDHDHTYDHALGGATDVTNLACLCKRHHTLKHATDWSVTQLPGGSLQWTSPSRRTYRDDPPPRVTFVPSPPF